MSSKFLAVLLIGGLCVAAAGGGAYLAVRQGAQAASQATTPPSSVAPAATPAPMAVATPVAAARTPDQPAPPAPASSATRSVTSVTPRPSVSPAATPSATVPDASAERLPQVTQETAQSGQSGAPVAESENLPPAAPSPYVPSRPTLENVPAEAAPAQVAAPERAFEELIVPADAVIGLQVERTISSDVARVEDRVDARVTRDVRVSGQVAIPAGAKARGTVTMVESGGKFKERARLGVRFHTILLADGTSIPIQAETIYREGASPAANSSAKIGGGAIGGAVIGALLGGGKGAAIGGSLGAGAGTAAVAAGRPNPATLASGSNVTVRLSRPAAVTIEKLED